MPLKSKTKQILIDAERDQLLDILLALCEKYPNLGEEIEFLLYPKTIKNPQSYYNKLVKRTIDTNSWSHFPNKGVKGLLEMVDKIIFFEKINNDLEGIKLAKAVLDIIARTKRNYNNQNAEELEEISYKLRRYNKFL
ncbi:MAG: hypothetical protein H7196_00930 [candidate division SR1 bacterium]|nr:hypothetical protein [candidate division SR1 bacterium]